MLGFPAWQEEIKLGKAGKTFSGGHTLVTSKNYRCTKCHKMVEFATLLFHIIHGKGS